MTPSLPTFFIASAMMVPINSSELAEIVPTWAIALSSAVGFDRFFNSPTAATTALSIPRFRSRFEQLAVFRQRGTKATLNHAIAWVLTVAHATLTMRKLER